MTETRSNSKLISFSALLLGQFVSVLGSGMTGFALGVWVFQRTGSSTDFALISLFAVLPGLVIAPFAGALVDRWDRRFAMILGDTGAAIGTVVVAILLYTNHLEIWQIYLVNIWISTFGAFQGPAFAASVTMLVSKEHFGRASGLVQMGIAIGQIASPIMAGALMGLIQLHGIITVDFVTYLFSLLVLLFIRIPRPPESAEGRAARGSLLREASFGWEYVKARPGLLGLLVFFAVVNFGTGFVQVLITPLVLSFTNAATLGTIVSIAGLGLLAGSLLMSIWGGPKRRVYGIFGCMIISGLVLLLGGFRPNVALVATAAAIFLFTTPVINGCSSAIWQSKVPPDVQGRIFAIRLMIGWSTLPISYLLAGPLADKVFEPALAVGGPLAGTVGQFLGTGPGRGIGFLFMLLGLFNFAITIGGFLYPRLRNLETELPDQVPDKAPPADTTPQVSTAAS
jgi:MFS transporter, DHA3 family, macrolide efflux protein